MNVNTLGVLNLMSHIINEEEGTSDFVITEYILNNLANLEALTINDIVDNVHVSRSSIRRYALRLGYENFSDIKTSFNDIAFPSNLHLRDFFDFNDYKRILDVQLIQMKLEMDLLMTQELIHKFVVDLETHDDICIYCANNTVSTMKKFQQELMFSKKLIKVKSSNFEESVNIDKDDNKLVIVISVSGIFNESIYNSLIEKQCKKILLTANRDERLTKQYQNIYFLSSRDVVEDKLGLLSKYGLAYFFDLVSQYYIYRNR